MNCIKMRGSAQPLQLFLLVTVVLLLALGACGGQPAPSRGGGERQSLLGNNVLYVVDGSPSSQSSQRLLVFEAVGKSSGKVLTLPVGLMSQDHHRLYRALAGGGQTRITVVDTRSGETLRSLTIAGSYSTADLGAGKSLLSGDGRWLVLRDLSTPAQSTRLALIDMVAGRLAATISLSGDFDLDGISSQGRILYLLEYLDRAAYHYNVRAYDVADGRLLPQVIVDKNEPDEKMQGLALTRQLAPNGKAAFTIYINPGQNKAFIHVLPLTDRLDDPLLARCVDLPTGTGAQARALLHFYTLALSQDEQTLYAVNAALGVMAVVDVRLAYDPKSVTGVPGPKTEQFSPGRMQQADAKAMSRQLAGGAVLSPDQRRLYVVGLKGIWVFDPQLPGLQSEYVPQQSFTGLTIDGTGRMLYAVSPTEGIIPIDLSSGESQAPLKVPARTPWAIGRLD
ncbi:hypothetical protein [Thermogemmatispora onikobensis]|uniref:hypothetical protein n=1 Tax=Thermogemmatispora onikobensis TaxID=732234 RepID=UPI00114D2275|nr:hypothetical protein [Thermogemmatispora onikobensis]